LLILENVWNKYENENSYRDMWTDVLAPLRFGRAGSKIVVTTRKRIVADLLNEGKGEREGGERMTCEPHMSVGPTILFFV
jgi:hypothetical protein